MVLFVSSLCPDCPPALKWVKDQGISTKVMDITESMKNLKVFLSLRDSHPFFKEIKAKGQVGIPVFYVEEKNKLVPFYEGIKAEDLK